MAKKITYKLNNCVSRCIIALLTILVLVPGCTRKPPNSLQVRVIDRQQMPVTEASVSLQTAQGKSFKLSTTDSGACLFEGVDTGTGFVVSVRKKGFITKTKKNIRVETGNNTLLIILGINSEIIPGRWRIARKPELASELSDEQRAQKEKLETLGYLAGHKSSTTKKNVTVYDEKYAYKGLNLYCSGHGPEAVLMDMTGTELHRWRYPLSKVWQNTYSPKNPEHQNCAGCIWVKKENYTPYLKESA